MLLPLPAPAGADFFGPLSFAAVGLAAERPLDAVERPVPPVARLVVATPRPAGLIRACAVLELPQI
ncbi:hypothetical protein H7J51_16230 [Mycobacterium crocinum]|uniref:Uncharacterized protein n=1 Tax=Mycolicibacterium crocinum TaxID=388459 RepID=A0ABY3TLN3_9MYCO|nr:hypothetical protein [Mycolicibacterium crocinum]MCV7216826.1 hypothetical protein [Mycolicibacterium crocinum]ULN40098.1 hypothetical protein MI149_20695 [Mycolicibacterium crocinum]